MISTELYDNVTEFQKEAKLLLEPKDENQSIPELEVLQKCLERGATFGIDLPEISRLKLVSFESLDYCNLGLVKGHLHYLCLRAFINLF